LSKIISESDIYLRSKVPEDMYDTLQKFAEIRKLDRANLVRDFNLFPNAVNLLTLERKYGDSLTIYDLNGQKPKKQRKPRPEQPSSVGDVSHSQSDNRTKFSEIESLTQRTTTVVGQKQGPINVESSDEDNS
jgi:hypothetical protein